MKGLENDLPLFDQVVFLTVEQPYCGDVAHAAHQQGHCSIWIKVLPEVAGADGLLDELDVAHRIFINRLLDAWLCGDHARPNLKKKYPTPAGVVPDVLKVAEINDTKLLYRIGAGFQKQRLRLFIECGEIFLVNFGIDGCYFVLKDTLIIYF